MGFRFKKSINLGGGVRLNGSKSGIGVSAGVKGLRVSHGADGKTRVTASIPGTGLSYQETIASNRQSRKYRNDNEDYQEINTEYDHENVFITFDAIHLGHYEDDRVLDNMYSHLINKQCTVTIVDDIIHIETVNNGSGKINYPAKFLVANKEIREIRGWFSKSTEVILQLTIDRDRLGIEKAIFKVSDESVADEVIDTLAMIKETIVGEQDDEIHEGIYEDEEMIDPFENDPGFHEFLSSQNVLSDDALMECVIYEISPFDAEKVALIVKVLKGEVYDGDEILLIGQENGAEIHMNAYVTDIIQNNAFVDFANLNDDVVVLLIEVDIEELDFIAGGGNIRNPLI